MDKIGEGKYQLKEVPKINSLNNRFARNKGSNVFRYFLYFEIQGTLDRYSKVPTILKLLRLAGLIFHGTLSATKLYTKS